MLQKNQGVILTVISGGSWLDAGSLIFDHLLLLVVADPTELPSN